MNKTEQQIKTLGLPVEVILDLWDGDWVVSACGECSLRKKNGKPAIFKTEEAAYNWIAKEFNLDNLVSKDEVIEWADKNNTSAEFITGKLVYVWQLKKWLEDK